MGWLHFFSRRIVSLRFADCRLWATDGISPGLRSPQPALNPKGLRDTRPGPAGALVDTAPDIAVTDQDGAPLRMLWDDTLLWKSPGGERWDKPAPSVETKGAQPSWL
jgi:hypothetical protein